MSKCFGVVSEDVASYLVQDEVVLQHSVGDPGYVAVRVQ